MAAVTSYCETSALFAERSAQEVALTLSTLKLCLGIIDRQIVYKFF